MRLLRVLGLMALGFKSGSAREDMTKGTRHETRDQSTVLTANPERLFDTEHG